MTVMRLFIHFFKLLLMFRRFWFFHQEIFHFMYRLRMQSFIILGVAYYILITHSALTARNFQEFHDKFMTSLKFTKPSLKAWNSGKVKNSHGQKTSCLEMSKKNPIYGYRPNSQKTSKITSKMCYIFQEGKRNITFQCVQSCKKVLWKVCVLMYQLQIGSPCWGADE